MSSIDHRVIDILVALCDEVGTPVASRVKALAQHGEWTELQSLRIDPHSYKSAEAYWRDTLCVDFLRKCDLPTSVDKKGAALATFYSCEAQNAASNARLNRYLPEHLLLEDKEQVAVAEFIDQWRKEVRSVLGYLPDHLTPRFSGGATFADTGKLTSVPDKMSNRPTIYPHSRLLSKFFWESGWGRAFMDRNQLDLGLPALDMRSVRGNIFFTVPKDGTKFRGCCKESSINVAFQLDVGRLIANRLLRIGIDKTFAQDAHRELARWGSVTGSLSTLDQSNASDTLCRVLPQLLLPRAWWELLDSLRATHTWVDRPDGKGKAWVRLEKFSSMGNGFTFELETLLFATLARTICTLRGLDPDRVSCFGDDLIVPSEATADIMSALSFFGFTPNPRKTFFEGSFRESCGGDFFGGVPVRAHFLEEIPDEPQKWIALANGLWRVARSDGACPSRARIVARAHRIAMGCVPRDIQALRGPASLGDIVFHDDNPACWSTTSPGRYGRGELKHVTSRDGHAPVIWLRAYMPVPALTRWDSWTSSIQLGSCTLGLSSRGVSRRNDVEGYRIGKIPVSSVLNTWLPN